MRVALGKTSLLAALAMAFAMALAVFASSANAQDRVCPPLDSGKIDTTGDPLSVTVTAPDGFLIDQYCVKAGSVQQGNGPVFVDVDPPQKTVTITYPSGKAVSNYSYSLVPEGGTTTDTTTTTGTDTTTTGTDTTTTGTDTTTTGTDTTTTGQYTTTTTTTGTDTTTTGTDTTGTDTTGTDTTGTDTTGTDGTTTGATTSATTGATTSATTGATTSVTTGATTSVTTTGDDFEKKYYEKYYYDKDYDKYFYYKDYDKDYGKSYYGKSYYDKYFYDKASDKYYYYKDDAAPSVEYEKAPAAVQYEYSAPEDTPKAEGELPETGGSSLLAVGAMVLLLGGGLTALFVVRRGDAG